MRLIGDIGGTNVRLALSDEKGEVFDVRVYAKCDFNNISDVVREYKKDTGCKPKKAVLAVNMPLKNGAPEKGHQKNWGYDELVSDIGFEKVLFLNDLLAQVMSVPYFGDADCVKLCGKPEKENTIATIGVGTGIGTAYGNFADGKYHFFPTEAGYGLVSTVTNKQADVLKKMIAKQGFVIWEDVVSGQGVANLYNALFDEEKTTEKVMKELHEGDSKAEEVFGLYAEFLGLFVRNIATTFLPYGGIYITGGVLSRSENLELLKKSRFLEFFNYTLPAKGGYMKDVPIYVVTNNNSALSGLAKVFDL